MGEASLPPLEREMPRTSDGLSVLPIGPLFAPPRRPECTPADQAASLVFRSYFDPDQCITAPVGRSIVTPGIPRIKSPVCRSCKKPGLHTRRFAYSPRHAALSRASTPAARRAARHARSPPHNPAQPGRRAAPDGGRPASRPVARAAHRLDDAWIVVAAPSGDQCGEVGAPGVAGKRAASGLRHKRRTEEQPCNPRPEACQPMENWHGEAALASSATQRLQVRR